MAFLKRMLICKCLLVEKQTHKNDTRKIGTIIFICIFEKKKLKWIYKLEN